MSDLDQVIESYHRCRANDAFFDAFYDFFLDKSPEIAAKFANTDFTNQKRMLRESILTMLCFNLESEGSREEIERLGRRHSYSQLDIKPEYYSMWLDSLCQCVALYDPDYTPQLENLWRGAMRKGIDLIISMYEPHT